MFINVHLWKYFFILILSKIVHFSPTPYARTRSVKSRDLEKSFAYDPKLAILDLVVQVFSLIRSTSGENPGQSLV